MNKSTIILIFTLFFFNTACTLKSDEHKVSVEIKKDVDAAVRQAQEAVESGEVGEEKILTSLDMDNEKQEIGKYRFDLKEIQNIQIKNLELSSIINAVYPNQIIKDKDYTNLSQLGENKPFLTVKFNEAKLCNCSHEMKTVQETIVAVEQKTIRYLNDKWEERFLIPIEIWEVNEDYSPNISLVPSHVEFFLFKQIKDGQFQLVSRTPPYYKAFEITPYSLELKDQSYADIKRNLQKIGVDHFGSYYESRYSILNSVDSNWHILILPEHEFIRSYEIGKAKQNNKHVAVDGEGFAFTSILKFKPNSVDQFFPIEIQYNGTKLGRENTIIANNERYKFIYDSKSKVYQYDEETRDNLLKEVVSSSD